MLYIYHILNVHIHILTGMGADLNGRVYLHELTGILFGIPSVLFYFDIKMHEIVND